MNQESLLNFPEFPHVEKQLKAIWENPKEVELYLTTLLPLLNIARPKRNGFPLKVFEQLIDLMELNEKR